ncbi:flagellar basal body L-ring protein FlgH [Engelhardtia mirabilis]|uniref:Flagellar L-ring protein n=1 Tax=Engelhardtia mirabilis TaxID=2528011 RepID=A0A518BSY5_9BACT|nr:Flagellar L-ring protein precursor [Planctomycetes bacterium Pla133]QDV04407.1 Flagellar L-ring protein precursor [Planctomycetes bacterium Pla86]
MRSRVLLLCLAIAAATPVDKVAAQVRPGSIYDVEHGPIDLIANKTARRVGDLVTVLISETQDVSNEESSGITKETALTYELLNLDVLPGAFDTLPSLDASSSSEFGGQATVSKRGTFEARLTAMVVDVLPNGNLVISGRREVRVDKEVKLIEFSGVVRKYDVSAANTVTSELVADARVAYTGNGPLTKASARNGFGAWVFDALDWLWPF